jgi:hypothetical protein
MFISVMRTRMRRVVPGAGSFAMLLLAACGGGMGGYGSSSGSTSPMNTMTPMPTTTSCSAPSCGVAMVTLTDAKGDFLSYIVTLTSLRLQTANGTSVETVPAATKIDFAQLVNLTEVLTAGQVPAAEYVSARLTIDYSHANITADDGAGNAVPLKPVGVTGNAITGTLTVTVQLDNAHHLAISAGHIGRLALDFNLAASNTVDLTAGTVKVAPTLVASVVPSDTKQIRVRGSLASASAAQNDFVVNVEPFHDEQSSSITGQMTVQVTATTTYQINGTAYVGDPGITALAALSAGTMVAAFGTLQTGTQQLTFTAASVLAGNSLENPALDQISGTVIARSHTALIVRGATWSQGDGEFDFERQDVMVTLASNTPVTEDGQIGPFNASDISVGQHVEAFGNAAQSSSGAVTLDATAGQVQLDVTPAWGVVTTLANGSVTLNLQTLGGLPANVFDFSGTGTSSENDANPTAYVVNTGTLSQTGLGMNEPARVLGFVTPFGSAPPDFTARTLVSFAAVAATLQVRFHDHGSTTAFSKLSTTSTALRLDLTNVDGDSEDHVIQIGPQRIDLTQLAAPPSIVPDTTATGAVFTIGHGGDGGGGDSGGSNGDGNDGGGSNGGGSGGDGGNDGGNDGQDNSGSFQNENFNTFADFVGQLAADLTGTTGVVAVTAAGHYDSATNTFTATRITVLLGN